MLGQIVLANLMKCKCTILAKISGAKCRFLDWLIANSFFSYFSRKCDDFLKEENEGRSWADSAVEELEGKYIKSWEGGKEDNTIGGMHTLPFAFTQNSIEQKIKYASCSVITAIICYFNKKMQKIYTTILNSNNKSAITVIQPKKWLCSAKINPLVWFLSE
jgi:hypothetical protein